MNIDVGGLPMEDGIAVVGMAGRWPGAASVDAFWDNLVAGRESISRFTDAELEDVFPREVRDAPNFVRARSVLDGIEMFDPGFFGMRAREAELTDPQHRVFLECAWEALEAAGHDFSDHRATVAVFAGCGMNGYLSGHVCATPGAMAAYASAYQVGEYPTLLGASADFLATRVSYKLDLRGPSVTVQTACSTSLVAVAQACQALLTYQADVALAGGVSITLPQRRGYLHDEGGMVSPDGRCRTFDARAAGTVFGSGAGVVALKRLDDALRDGDHIHAVIRGSAVNNDGATKIGFTAPSIERQADVVRAAHAAAGVAPWSIGYVECHGTATPLGDPIEVAALVRAFGPADGAGPCVLSSAKPNVGHLDVAAGVTGLIKAVLCLERGTIPPTLHFTELNPRIDLAGQPFRVSGEPVAWKRGYVPRRAGVSALGVGGTNVHVVLEEAPAPLPRGAAPPVHLLTLSARSAGALAAQREALAARIEAEPGIDLADAAHTLATGRRVFDHRFAATCTDRASAVTALRDGGNTAATAAAGLPVAFMFPGQGSQHPGMARATYLHDPGFRRRLDECAELLEPLLGLDIRQAMFADPADAGSHERLRSTHLAQPAILAVGWSLGRTLMDRGMVPAGMIGHSVGEFAAACLAGVFTLPDALAIVAARGRLMADLPGGGMLAVRLGESELAPLLGPALSLAAVNGPALCTVAGSDADLADLAASLARRGVVHRALQTSHAFHSAAMDPILDALADIVSRVQLQAPVLPYVSGVTGTWITDAEATSPAYWARHCREPVRFADGLATLVAGRTPALLELGPGRSLASMAWQGAARGSTAPVVSAFDDGMDSAGEAPDLACFLGAMGRLWGAGAGPDRPVVHHGTGRRFVPLPTYPFERTRHWIDAPGIPTDDEKPERPVMQPKAVASPAITPAGASDPAIAATILEILRDLSGEDMDGCGLDTTFLELGFDSLFLSQVAQQLQKTFGVKVTFRQLLGAERTVARLSSFVAAAMPQAAPAAPVPASRPTTAAPQTAPAVPNTVGGGDAPMVQAIMRDQLQAMSDLVGRQLAALQSISGGTAAAAAPATAASSGTPPAPARAVAPPPSDADRFAGLRPGVRTGGGGLDPAKQRHIADLVSRYVAKTPGSKRITQDRRAVMADPRVAAGFRSEWKEMTYPITTVRSAGPLLWDVDGNQYVDILNGFGQTAFGHAPPWIVAALSAQLALGFEVGPQTPLAGEVAALVCELTGNERVAFCNTGSEAVMAAMRVARAVTGRDRIVLFSGAYHGQFDEVLVKGTRRAGEPTTTPAASGIPTGSVGNVTVLEYATAESAAWIRANADEIAAVIVEPVQSRRPGLQPRAFLEELRDITERSGTALVFDEVVTGFRTHPGGMQAVFGIRADMATYGKIVGGGLPIGLLAGKARFMDALDGGMWRYGDDSAPEADVTFFAGTFVRHPLALAAARAVLLHMRDRGPALQAGLTARTADLVAALNDVLATRGIDARIDGFSSFFFMNLSGVEPNAGLLYHHMRLRGVHVQEGFPCFLTTTHGDAEVARVIAAFAGGIDEMQAAGFFPRRIAAPSIELQAASSPAIPVARAGEVSPTPSQIEVWLAGQLGDAASCAFNESVTLRMSGGLQVSALQAALDDVAARHDALRLAFSPSGESMRARPPASVRLDVAGPTDEAELERIIGADAGVPFDLVDGPVVRATLVRLLDGTHALVLTAHHIVCDGWSMNVVIGDLARCYAARRDGTMADLPPAASFLDHAAAVEADPSGVERDADWWVERFGGPIPVLQLPGDRPPPAVRTFRGDTVTATLDADALRSAKRAGAALGGTLFTTLLAAFATLVGRLAGQRDVVVAVPTAGQALLDDPAPVGHCVGMLPVRIGWDRKTTVRDLVGEVGQTVMDAREHGGCTLGTIVRKLDPVRSLGATALASVQFNLERLGTDAAVPGLDVTVAPNPKRFTQFALFLNVTEGPDGLRLDCDYDAEAFDAATVRRWLDHYREILVAFAQDAGTAVERVALLSKPERQRMLATDNDTATAQAGTTVHAMFAAQAARRPDAVAVRLCDVATTYGELDRRANQIAAHLRRRLGVAEARIGVAVERSADMIAVLLGVLKAGYAYVPLDPHHPPARQAAILAGAAAAAVVCDDAWSESATGGLDGPVAVRLGADAAAIAAEPDVLPDLGEAGPDALAYVIYTSGSTGVPKGVEVTHGALANLLGSMREEPGMREDDVMCAVTTVAFDIAALELFLPLRVGATVAVATRTEVADGTALRARLHAVGATVIQATPATWSLLLEAGFESHPGLRMLCGGERWTRGLADRLLAGGGALWNMYGPTETTIWSSLARVTPGPDDITIGRPIANTRLHVLGPDDEPVPPGVAGELHIAGAGVARGYRGDPARTAARFVPDPFAGGLERMFRTGDAARRMADGRIVLLGRLDLQVKLRGFRIEIEEVEAALASAAGLAASAVAICGAGDSARLVGYYVERAGELRTPAELRDALRRTLPDYMIPIAWVALPALPTSLNGKLDRAALPEPYQATEASTLVVYRPPVTPLEGKLCSIWAEVLRLDTVGLDDDILDLGADSIHVFKIVARANREGVALSAGLLFGCRTIGALAAAVEAREGKREAERRPSPLFPGLSPGLPPGLPSLADAATLRRRRPGRAGNQAGRDLGGDASLLDFPT